MNCSGETAVITGGASGLGLASAKLLADRGTNVVIWDLNDDIGSEVASKLGGSYVNVDVANADAVESALDATIRHYGAPRILVHCAGIALGEKLASSRGPHGLDSFARVINVNLLGTFYCCRAIAQSMLNLEPTVDGERGVLITTASIAATEGQVGQTAYAASKAAVLGMVLPMARDLARQKVRCVAITPGLFDTNIAENQSEKVIASLTELFQYPDRFGTPAEFASLVLEVCRNPMINGTHIRLDGAVRLSAR